MSPLSWRNKFIWLFEGRHNPASLSAVALPLNLNCLHGALPTIPRRRRIPHLPHHINRHSPVIHDWLVGIFPSPKTPLQTGIDTRPEHLSHNVPLLVNHTLIFGGPSLSSQPSHEDPTALPINGSIMCMRAESEEKVHKIIAADPHARVGSGKWRKL